MLLCIISLTLSVTSVSGPTWWTLSLTRTSLGVWRTWKPGSACCTDSASSMPWCRRGRSLDRWAGTSPTSSTRLTSASLYSSCICSSTSMKWVQTLSTLKNPDQIWRTTFLQCLCNSDKFFSWTWKLCKKPHEVSCLTKGWIGSPSVSVSRTFYWNTVIRFYNRHFACEHI